MASYPDDLLYTESHEWVRVENDVATVGITAFAVSQLTDLIDIDLQVTPGQSLKVGQSFGEIESVKAASDLYSPVTGEVLEVNAELASDLDAIADDPHGRGWMVKIKLADTAQLDGLLAPDAYAAQVEKDTH